MVTLGRAGRRHLRAHARYLADGGAVTRQGRENTATFILAYGIKLFYAARYGGRLLPISWAQAGVSSGGTHSIYHAGARH